MRSVAERVGVLATNSIITKRGTTAKLSVGCDDTTVNNIGVSVLASGVVINVACGGAGLVRDGTKTPGSAGLRGESTLVKDLLYLEGEVDKLIRLNCSNL